MGMMILAGALAVVLGGWYAAMNNLVMIEVEA